MGRGPTTDKALPIQGVHNVLNAGHGQGGVEVVDPCARPRELVLKLAAGVHVTLGARVRIVLGQPIAVLVGDRVVADVSAGARTELIGCLGNGYRLEGSIVSIDVERSTAVALIVGQR